MYIELSPVSHALRLTISRPNSTHSFSHDVVSCKKCCNPSQLLGSPQLQDHSSYEGRPYSGISHDTQPYRDFAAGGHVEFDKNLVALAEQEAAEARGKQLDEENFAALFSDPGDATLVANSKKMTLVRTMSNGEGGSRGVWKGTYKPPRPKNASPEASLLDL